MTWRSVAGFGWLAAGCGYETSANQGAGGGRGGGLPCDDPDGERGVLD